MRHLKIYESNEYMPELSKYIIWATPKNSPSFYNIVEIINKLKNKAYINILYTYTIKEDRLTKDDMDAYFKEYDIIKKSIVYQTDTLKDALDILPRLNSIQKYNL